MQVHRALCTLGGLSTGHTGEATVVWEEGRRGGGESEGKEPGSGRGETNSNRELHQFPQTRNFLPGQAQDSGSP